MEAIWCLVFVIIQIAGCIKGCTTNHGHGDPCVFPFKFKGEIFFTCTVYFNPQDNRPMCPTAVDPATLLPSTNDDDWGLCHKDCPMTTYLTNPQLREAMSNISESHPDLATTYPLQFKSVLGEELRVLKLSSNVDRKRSLLKPMVRLIANMHGNEVVGREVLLQLARLLVLGYSRDNRIRKILDNAEVHLLPTMNPDGFNRAREGECGGQDYGSGRYNEGKVDLNRDFPAWFNINSAKGKDMEKLLAKKQPETQAVARWIMSGPWVLSANIHDGAVVASYPWDHYQDDRKVGDHMTPDDLIFKSISVEYADSHLTMTNTSSCAKYGYLGGSTNGAAWYPKNGTLKDFGYKMSPALEFVLELSCCKYPKPYFLPREFEYNRESLLRFLERSVMAVRGLVVDLAGQPAGQATVIFTQNGKSAGKDMKTTERGEFWKILVPGKYRVQAVLSGCVESGSMPLVVKAGQQTKIKLTLRRRFNCIRK